jgi:hypothetical protein
VVPLPPASEFQRVRDVRITGSEVLGFGLDRYGNSVVVLAASEEMRLGFTVTTRALRTTLPGDYSYRSEPHPDLAASFAYTGDIDFRSLPGLREEIAAIARQEAPETFAGGFFDPAFLELYPVSDEAFYLVHGAALARTGEEVGIVGRFANGIIVPRGGDYFLPDFRLEYYVPGRGVSSLQKSLAPLAAGGGFIALASSFENRYWASYALLDSADDPPRFLRGTVRITVARPDADPLPLIFDTPLWYPGWSADGFLVTKTDEAVPAFVARSERSYRDETADLVIEEVILAQDYQSGQAVGVKETFGEFDKVTAILRMKEPGPDRNFECRWVLPDGRTFYTWQYVPGATWRSFYTNINGNRNKLEKGLWRLEISVNGVLDYRRHFEVR